jgi:hypothetical protein
MQGMSRGLHTNSCPINDIALIRFGRPILLARW